MSKEVLKIYVSNGCEKCMALERFLDTNNVKYEKYNATENKDYIPSNLQYLPILNDNGTWVQGLIPAKQYVQKVYLSKK